MILQNAKFVLFGDFRNIEAEPGTIMELSQEFMKGGIMLLPGTFQQMKSTFEGDAFDRIMFSDSKMRVTVKIGIDFIEIDQVFVENKKYNLPGNNLSFIKTVTKVLKGFYDSKINFNLGTRVGLIFEKFHDADNLPSDVNNKFNNIFENPSENEFFEWNTRGVQKKTLENLEMEEFNIGTEVGKVAGELATFGKFYQFNTVLTKSDINSLQETNSVRIDLNYIEKFLMSGLKLYEKNDELLEVKIYGEPQ